MSFFPSLRPTYPKGTECECGRLRLTAPTLQKARGTGATPPNSRSPRRSRRGAARRSRAGLTPRSVDAARLTFPEAPGPGARRAGWPAPSRSPLSARGGSSRDSGNKEVEARARARIPGAGGAQAPRPRPATHGAESRQPLSLLLLLRVAIGGLGGQVWEHRSLRRLFSDACRGPRGQAPGSPRKTAEMRASPRHPVGAGGDSSCSSSSSSSSNSNLESPGRPVPAALAAHRKRPPE